MFRLRTRSGLPVVAALALLGPAASSQSQVPLSTPVDGYQVRRWSTREGLPQNSVAAIAQTPDGDLWLGTFGGLVRFDGVDFEVFDVTNTPALRTNRILALGCTRSGVLWIGTEGNGIALRDGEDFQRPAPEVGAPIGTTWAIAEDAEGGVWFAGTTVARWDGERFTDLADAFGPGVSGYGLFAERDTLWIGAGRCLGRWSASEGLHVEQPTHERRSDRLGAAVRDAEGGLWFADHSGVRRTAGGPFAQLTSPSGQTPVYALVRLRDGQVWCASGSGLYALRTARGEPPRLEVLLSDEEVGTVRSVFEDREGNVWVGTDGQGLLRLRPQEFEMPRERYPDLPDNTSQIVSDGADGVWARGQDGSLVHVSAEGPPRPVPASLTIGWGGHCQDVVLDGVLHVYHGRRHSWLLPDGSFASEDLQVERPVTSFLHTPETGSWMTDGTELLHLEGGAWRAVAVPELEGRRPSLLSASPGGRLWIQADSHLIAWGGGQPTLDLGLADGLPRGAYRDVWEERPGVAWLSTYGGGLCRISDGRVARIDTQDGLLDNALGCILPDGRGNLWLNSNRGVFRIALEELHRVADGRPTTLACRVVPTPEGNGPDGVRTSDGRLWLPTIEGIAVVDTSAIGDDLPPPTPRLRYASVDGERMRGVGELKLTPDHGPVAIHYTAPTFRDPETLRFRYRISGVTDGWVDVGARRSVELLHLPAGRFTFEVSARASQSEWSAPAGALVLDRAPRLSEQTWFLALVAALVGGTLFAGHRFRVRQVAARANLLAREIEQRERVQRALAASEERYRHVVEDQTDFLLRWRPDGTRTFVNDAYCRSLGTTRERCLTEHAWSHVEGNDAEGLARLVARLSPGTPAETRRVRLARAEGEESWTEWTDQAFFDAEGRLLEVQSVGRDVTDLVRAEGEAERHRQELVEAEKMIALGTLVAGVAHEINNPNQFVMLNAPILREVWRTVGPIVDQHAAQTPGLRLANIPWDRMRDEVPEMLQEIERGAERIKSIVSDLREYARGTSSRSTGPIDLNEVVRSALNLIANPVRKATNHLTVELAPTSPKAHGNALRIEQVVINLVQNACEALDGPDRAIRVTTEDDPARGQVRVVVRDEGCGIAPADLARVLDPFFTTKRERGGTGLGLAVSMRIVNDHKGQLELTSAPGGGTTARLTLPSKR